MLPHAVLTPLRRLIPKPTGIIFFIGPAGSGNTTNPEVAPTGPVVAASLPANHTTRAIARLLEIGGVPAWSRLPSSARSPNASTPSSASAAKRPISPPPIPSAALRYGGLQKHAARPRPRRRDRAPRFPHVGGVIPFARFLS